MTRDKAHHGWPDFALILVANPYLFCSLICSIPGFGNALLKLNVMQKPLGFLHSIKHSGKLLHFDKNNGIAHEKICRPLFSYHQS